MIRNKNVSTKTGQLQIIAVAGLSRPRRRQAGYVSKGVPYPTPVSLEPGATHQIDLIEPDICSVGSNSMP